jgi:ribosome-associated heat shock protein Hsp15
MRIDRLLCNLRFLRTRTMAADLVREGHLRRNGVRVARPSQTVAVGDVLTIPLGRHVRLIEVLALPERRGPAREAQGCYRALDPAGETDIGQPRDTDIEGYARP